MIRIFIGIKEYALHILKKLVQFLQPDEHINFEHDFDFDLAADESVESTPLWIVDEDNEEEDE
jgi:hypothetical protein